MAIRSVIDITVNDSEFVRFQELFNNYATTLQQTPNLWRRAAQGAGATANAAQNAANSAHAQAGALGQVIVLQTQVTQHANAQASAWSRMARSASGFANHIADATRSLLRWGALTGLISGILGAGGLYGIDRLAVSAGNQRSQAFGLGTKPGETRAWETQFGERGYDARGFLGNINKGMLDITSEQYRSLLLLGENTKGKDTNTVALESLTKLKDAVDKIALGPLFEPIARQRGLDQLMDIDDLQRLRRTPRDEALGYASKIRESQGALGFSDATAKAWQDLKVRLADTAAALDNLLIKKLVALAPAIDKLSAAFLKVVTDLLSRPELEAWIKKFADGIQWLAEYLFKDEFKAKVGHFVEGVAAFVDGTASFVKSISEELPKLDEVLKDIIGTFEFFRDTVKAIVEALKSIEGIGPPKLDDYTAPPKEGGKSYLQQWEDGVLGWFGYGKTSATPRGVRDNNPLNINYSEGQGAIGRDGRFSVFASPEAGVAASERQLLAYQQRGYDTISKLISKWAPPSENDTAGYIAAISKATGIGADARIDLNDPTTARAVIGAMIKQETGRYLDKGAIDRGVAAGISAPPIAKATTPKQQQVMITIQNNTGGNAYVSSSQLIA